MNQEASYSISQEGNNRLAVHLEGTWTRERTLPDTTELLDALPRNGVLHLSGAPDLCWDSMLPVFLLRLEKAANARGARMEITGLPEGIGTLLELADRGSGRAPEEPPREGIVTRIGRRGIRIYEQGGDLARFAGTVLLALARMLRGRTAFRFSDFFYFLQNCGAEALPIVSLISVLVGIILAFVGAVQLSVFGAQIYVANLVALSMVIEMGAMMSGVIIAGRTGAAYAAQLGTMQVNEEIDALRTLGVSPTAYLVLPRMLALVFMLPLLCIYADLLGIAGGSLIGTWMLDLTLQEYLHQAKKGLHLYQISQGIIKSAVYGVLISFAGCYHGMHCGRSASAVGEATTSAVVMSIVLMVIADAILTVIFSL